MLVRVSYATFLRNWRMTLRAYPWSFFIGGLLTGVLAVLLAYFTFHLLAGGRVGSEFARYAGTADYMSYAILGAGLYLFVVELLLAVSRSLITEGREGTLESLLLAPARRLGYLAGVAAQAVTRCGLELCVMLLVTWPLGLSFSHVNPLTLLLALPVALVGTLGVAVALGAVMLAARDTYLSQNTLFIAMGLLCGFTFPPQYLPLPLQWLGAALPVTGALRLLRAALLEGASPAAIIPDLLTTTLLGILYIAIGMRLLRWAERRALERGSM